MDDGRLGRSGEPHGLRDDGVYEIFGYPRERATQLMIQVHNQGRVTVAEGSKEEMEVAVHAMHGYGLQASVEKGGQG